MTKSTPRSDISDDDLTSRFTIVRDDDHRGTVRLTVQGELDAATAPTVAQFIRTALRCRRPRQIVVDLAAVPFVDAAGVCALLDGYWRACACCTGFHVVAAQGMARRVLQITGASDLLTGRPDASAPRGAIRAAEPGSATARRRRANGVTLRRRRSAS